MDNPASPEVVVPPPTPPINNQPQTQTPWWKKGMSLKQLGVYLGISLFFVLAGFGISYLLERSSKSSELTTPAMAQEVGPGLLQELTIPTSIADANDNTLTIEGKTIPDVPIVVFSQTGTASVRSDVRGNFSIQMIMVEGENNISLTVVSPEGTEESVNRIVWYSTNTQL